MRSRFAVSLGMMLVLAGPALGSDSGRSAPLATAPSLTHAAFSGEFKTTSGAYKLTQSFDYPSGQIPLTKMVKGMACIAPSSDGCEEEGCVAYLSFDIRDQLVIRNLANDQTVVDLASPSALGIRLDQKNCGDPNLEMPQKPQLSNVATNGYVDFQLEGVRLQEQLYFVGHGTLFQDPKTKSIALRDFDFDSGSGSDGHTGAGLVDFDCNKHSPIFEGNGCQAFFPNGLHRDP